MSFFLVLTKRNFSVSISVTVKFHFSVIITVAIKLGLFFSYFEFQSQLQLTARTLPWSAWTHPTQNSKLHLDRFHRFRTGHDRASYALQCALKRN